MYAIEEQRMEHQPLLPGDVVWSVKPVLIRYNKLFDLFIPAVVYNYTLLPEQKIKLRARLIC